MHQLLQQFKLFSSILPTLKNFKMKFVIIFAACLIAAACAAPKEVVPILKHVENHDEQGQYTLEYLSADGSNIMEEGHLIDGPEGQVLVKKGSFKYTVDGVTYEVSYVADQNGFRATGSHLPKDQH